MHISFPTFNSIYSALKRPFLRFPFAISAAIFITLYYFVRIDHLFFTNTADSVNGLFAPIAAASLAYPIFIATALLREKYKWSLPVFITQGLVITAIFTLYGYFLSNHDLPGKEMIRYQLWSIASLAILTIILFIEKKVNLKKFWAFNEQSIRRLIRTIAIGIVIFLGIALALLATSLLFEYYFDPTTYSRIWIIVTAIFGSFYFLSGIPRLNQVEYKSLQIGDLVLAKYILLPLISAYFLILYAYTGSILIKSEWPEGILAYLISGFSLMGILLYAVVYPTKEKWNWVHWYEKIFFIALIPQVAMLFWAFNLRFLQYGFTEKRYFLLAFGVWLLLQALYFLFSKSKDLRFIPTSLLVFLLLSSFGTWGAFAVSKKSQLNRFIEITTEKGLLKDGAVIKTNDVLDSVTEKELRSVMSYLLFTHDETMLNSFFNEDLSETIKYRFVTREEVLILFEVSPNLNVAPYLGSTSPSYRNLSIQRDTNWKLDGDSYELSNYSGLFRFQSTREDCGLVKCNLRLGVFNPNDDDHYYFFIENESAKLNVNLNKEIFYEIDLTGFVNELSKKSYRSTIDMTFTHEEPGLSFDLVIDSVIGRSDGDQVIITKLDGLILLVK